ncbi:energy transducer TonB [Sphingomonas sp. UYP23]
MQPTAKWAVDYADTQCVLSRPYETGAGPLTFGVRTWPVSGWIDIILIEPHPSSANTQSGRAKFVMGPTVAAIDTSYTSAVAAKDQPRITTLTIPEEALATLADAPSVDLVFSGKARVSVALLLMKPALHALSTCNADLLRTWHIDPAERTLAVTKAKAIGPERWITNADVPSQVLDPTPQGAVMLVWLIDTDGRVKNCSVVIPSGEPSADAAACAAITQHGRYRPALDKDGTPLATHSGRRIFWNDVR